MAVNIGMTIGLLPITGVTLPFVSYGGSSLVAVWAMTGILVGLGIRPPTGSEREAFDDT
jgi:cell division protein FtsW (lipid II flippase)